MKVKFETGAETIIGTEAGDTFYVSGGRSIVRGRKTPISAGTEPRLKETSGVVAASKKWSYELSAAEKAAWGACVPPGLVPRDWFVWIWSVFDWIFGDFGPIDPPCGIDVDIRFDDFVFDSCSESVVVRVGVVSGPADVECWIGMSAPTSPGRVPGVKDWRTISRRIPTGVLVELGPEFFGRFGSFPEPGSVVSAGIRGCSFSTGAVSDVIEASTVVLCGGGGQCQTLGRLVIDSGVVTENILFWCGFPDFPVGRPVPTVVVGGSLVAEGLTYITNYSWNECPFSTTDPTPRTGTAAMKFDPDASHTCSSPFEYQIV